MKVAYSPIEDELGLEICPKEGAPDIDLDHFKLWLDNEGKICTFVITNYSEESKEFKKHLKMIQLGGIWKGVEITDEDIREARKEMLRGLEEKY